MKTNKTQIKSLKELREIGQNIFRNKNIVNTNIEPTCEEYMRVVEHIKMGSIELSKLKLYDTNKQKEPLLEWEILFRESLKNNRVINASVLDRFVIEPEIIPESWKRNKDGKMQVILFLGTIYAHITGSLYIRTMYFNENQNKWEFRNNRIIDYCDKNNTIVILSD